MGGGRTWGVDYTVKTLGILLFLWQHRKHFVSCGMCIQWRQRMSASNIGLVASALGALDCHTTPYPIPAILTRSPAVFPWLWTLLYNIPIFPPRSSHCGGFASLPSAHVSLFFIQTLLHSSSYFSWVNRWPRNGTWLTAEIFTLAVLSHASLGIAI